MIYCELILIARWMLFCIKFFVEKKIDKYQIFIEIRFSLSDDIFVEILKSYWYLNVEYYVKLRKLLFTNVISQKFESLKSFFRRRQCHQIFWKILKLKIMDQLQYHRKLLAIRSKHSGIIIRRWLKSNLTFDISLLIDNHFISNKLYMNSTLSIHSIDRYFAWECKNTVHRSW